MDVSIQSLIGIIVATVASFMVGGFYYGVMGKPWMKAARIDPAEAKMSASLFVVSIVSELVMAVVVSFLIGAFSRGQDTSIISALTLVFLLWLGIVMSTQVINHRYQGFGWDLTLIDGVHWLLVLLVQGAVIGYFGAIKHVAFL